DYYCSAWDTNLIVGLF
nr:immunoglobulin light chain junction region [Macaca mulatta]